MTEIEMKDQSLRGLRRDVEILQAQLTAAREREAQLVKERDALAKHWDPADMIEHADLMRIESDCRDRAIGLFGERLLAFVAEIRFRRLQDARLNRERDAAMSRVEDLARDNEELRAALERYEPYGVSEKVKALLHYGRAMSDLPYDRGFCYAITSVLSILEALAAPTPAAVEQRRREREPKQMTRDEYNKVASQHDLEPVSQEEWERGVQRARTMRAKALRDQRAPGSEGR